MTEQYTICPDCDKRIRPMRRYPFAPLATYLGMSEGQAARRVGLAGSTAKQARCHGLSRHTVETIAGKLRVHPSELWPEVIDHDIEDTLVACSADGCTERFVPRNRANFYCSKRCKNRMKARRYRATPAGKAANLRVKRAYKETCNEYLLVYNRNYYRANRDRALAYQKQWRRRNAERQREYNRQYRARQREKSAA